MTVIRSTFIILLFSTFTIACSTNETKPSYFIKKFRNDRQSFEILLQDLRNDDLTSSRNIFKIFRPSDFKEAIKNKLRRLGIKEFNFYVTGCQNASKFSIDLTTNWTTAFPVHLEQLPCEQDISFDKAYFKRDNGNEGWGLGDNWVVWFEHTSTKGILTYYDKKTDTLQSTPH